MPSLRPAEPGEFSRRAYLAGQMDIAQAEALIDLVDAETEGQRIVARRGVSVSLVGCPKFVELMLLSDREKLVKYMIR
jgi:tRNA U34 5-carboxymethylaminomethyl modifying GTPase MnmE/TrmE